MNGAVKKMIAAGLFFPCSVLFAGGPKGIALGTLIQGRPAIMTKWISPEVYYDEGISVYRKELPDGQWIRMTPQPLRYGKYSIPDPEFKSDTTLSLYCKLSAPRNKPARQDMLNILLLLKIIENNHFAQYTGMMFTDTTIRTGIQYLYTAISKNDTAYTNPVSSADTLPDLNDIRYSFKAGDGKCHIHWTRNDKKFYGVNIYRREEGSELRKLNRQPVIARPAKKHGSEDTCFTDSGLPNGKKYYYSLGFVGYFGKESERTPEEQIIPHDQTPPLRPPAPEPKIKKNNIYLSIPAFYAQDVTFYHLLRSTHYDTGYTDLGPIAMTGRDTLWIDSIRHPSVYYYCIEARDSAGNISRSARSAVEMPDIFPPAVPAGLTCRGDSARIELNWDAVSDSDLAGYHVFRSVTENMQHFVLLTPEPLSNHHFTDHLPAQAASRFTYRVASVDTGLNVSPPSAAVSCKMKDKTPPVQPFIRNIVTTNDTVKIEWLANCDHDLLGYALYRATEGQTARLLTPELLPANRNSYLDVTALNSGKYIYYLQAIDSSLNRSELSNYRSAIISCKKQLQETISLTATVVRKGIQLRWDNQQNDSCLVFRKTDNSSFIPVSSFLRQGTFTDRTVSNDKTYTYQVKIYGMHTSVRTSEKVTIHKPSINPD